MKNLLSLFLIVFTLAGCAMETESDRINRCLEQGVSRDVCYHEERADNRAQSIFHQSVFEKQNAQVIKDLGIKGIGLPK
jgi:hypothetical protein